MTSAKFDEPEIVMAVRELAIETLSMSRVPPASTMIPCHTPVPELPWPLGPRLLLMTVSSTDNVPATWMVTSAVILMKVPALTVRVTPCEMLRLSLRITSPLQTVLVLMIVENSLGEISSSGFASS